MKPQMTPNNQSSLDKEEQSWRHHIFWFQNCVETLNKENTFLILLENLCTCKLMTGYFLSKILPHKCLDFRGTARAGHLVPRPRAPPRREWCFPALCSSSFPNGFHAGSQPFPSSSQFLLSLPTSDPTPILFYLILLPRQHSFLILGSERLTSSFLLQGLTPVFPLQGMPCIWPHDRLWIP